MKLHSTQYSEAGPALIILHGLFGNLKNWNRIARELSQRYCVYNLDLRNHGESPHSDEMDYQLMAVDVCEFMDDHEIDSAIIMGHSMGGKVAMQFALSNPDRVNRLVVIDIAPINYDAARGDHAQVFAGLNAVDLNNIASRSEADEALAVAVTEKAVRQFLLTNLMHTDSGGYQWRFNLDALQSNYDRLRAAPVSENPFDDQVLFVKGALSNYVQDKDIETVLKYFPNAEIKSIEGAGHWLHAEKPGELLAVLNSFLNVEDS